MSSSVLNVTFDCVDIDAQARFWSEVTGWPGAKHEMPGNPFWVVSRSADDAPRLVFVHVHDTKVGKNRVHLDLLPSDGSQDGELARLQTLGGRVVDDRRGVVPGGWVVMADPEGNEFCLEAGSGGSQD
jgi:predicted enzyme related to lactoylglutathione lyase